METVLDQRLLAHLASAAAAAPSLPGVRPWRLEADGEVLALYANRGATLAATDPYGHATRLACGAALLNVRVAASQGYRTVVRLLPDADDPTLLATVRFAGPHRAGARERRLCHAIWVRRAGRGLACPVELPSLLLAEAREAAHLEGAHLTYLTQTGTVTGDGPEPGVGSAEGVDYSYLAVLRTAADRPADQLRAGQALQRVLLQLAAHGVAAGFVPRPRKLAGLPPAERHTGSTESVHVILRLGYPVAAGLTTAQATSTTAISAAAPPPAWRLLGGCSGTASELFFEPDSESTRARTARETAATAVCRRCPVRPQCAEYALAIDEPYGVWGGMTPTERRKAAATRRTDTAKRPEKAENSEDSACRLRASA